jgi:exonuclease III
LDYVLLSNVLTSKVTKVEIERGGMPKRAKKYTGPRFRGVGQDSPKASDHCPVVVELNILGM